MSARPLKWEMELFRRYLYYLTHMTCIDRVVIARGPHPIPSRTRSLSLSAPMVLCLKARESRSLPGLYNSYPMQIFFEKMHDLHTHQNKNPAQFILAGFLLFLGITLYISTIYVCGVIMRLTKGRNGRASPCIHFKPYLIFA